MTGEVVVPAYRTGSRRETEKCSSDAVADWLQLVRSEYLEIPGLNLTKPQVRRLWNLDGATCDMLLEALTEMKFLKQTANGMYVRMDAA